jgi:hypothetical protein
MKKLKLLSLKKQNKFSFFLWYNYKGDNMKNKLGIFISVISIILFAIYIDYDYAKRTNKLPKLVLIIVVI